MKLRKIGIILLICIGILLLVPTTILADQSSDITNIIGGMSGVDEVSNTDGNIAKMINSVIRLIQVAGTGIAVIVVTMLGIRYMLASSNEKAEIKKMAMPIIIGCVLLFGAVNLVAILADVGVGLNS